jgi:hypothetical protein
MPHRKSLEGRTVLIVECRWIIARTLADAFEAKGAKVVMTKNSLSGLADLPNLSAAILDSSSGDLPQRLSARGIPFILYTARGQTDDAPIVKKPAPVGEVVARVEELLA